MRGTLDRRTSARALAAAVGSALLATLTMTIATAAEPWPSQPLHIIVGFPAGTSPDTVARLVSEPLARAFGKPVIVENRPGAGGNIGVDDVVRSKDGHTIGITTNGPLTTAKQLYPKLPYDPAKDVVSLGLAATSALVLVSSTTLPVSSIKEFVAYAKAHPGAISYGSIGAGSGSHLTMELFANEAGISLVHIPYAGYPQVTSALIAQDIQASFMAPSGALVQAKAGKVKILGVSSPARTPLVPAAPTVAEAAGLPEFRAELWIAAFAPANMPPDIARRLADEINAALRLPDVQDKLAQQGWSAAGGSPEAMKQRIRQDTALWGEVIKKANVHLE